MEPGFLPSQVDTGKPHPARLYNYYLGGKDNYVVDREAAAAVLKAVPEVRAIALENRAFLRRAVQYLVREGGISQIIDIGTGIPSAGNVHEVASEIQPGVRVVYVDNDPIVHVHANALLTGDGNTRIVLGDLRDPAAILADPRVRSLIDFDRPVALLLVAILHFITDHEKPGRIVADLLESLPPGSYLVLSHGTSDFHSRETLRKAAACYDTATAPLVLRTRDQIAEFFDGLDMIDPGLVQVPLWRPDRQPPGARDLARIGIYGGIGRKH